MAFDWGSFLGDNIGKAFAQIVGAFKAPPEAVLAAQTEVLKAQAELQGKILDQVTAQTAVNQAEAASPKIFVAGWRPFIGWICGTGLGYDFVFRPIVNGLVAIWRPALVPFQPLDLSTLLPLLLGMLGLGTMRMYEKINGAPGADKLQ